MYGTLANKIELNESNSIVVRDKILKRHALDSDHFFNQVIFDRSVELEITFTVPVCDVRPFDRNRLRQLLPSTTELDEYNDLLYDFNFLSSLTPECRHEIKSIFNVHLLDELLNYCIFMDTGTYCKRSELGLAERTKTFSIDRLPKIPYYFCWLQILPIVKSYPRKFLPAFNTECHVRRVRVFTKEYTVIREKLLDGDDADTLHSVSLIPAPEDDVASYLFKNRSGYDVRCAMNQLRSLDAKLFRFDSLLLEEGAENAGVKEEEYGCREKFVHFIVHDPKAGLAYLAQHLVKFIQNDKSFVWYK